MGQRSTGSNEANAESEDSPSPVPERNDRADSTDGDVDARRGQIMDLALRLLEKEGRDRGQSLLELTADPARNPVFQRALKQADSILRMCNERDYDIHAYQLFEEGEVLSALSVSKRFEEVGWDDFSRNTVAKFLGDLRKRMGIFADQIADRVPIIEEEKAERAVHKIVAALDLLSEDLSVRAGIPSFPEHASEFVASVISPYQKLTEQEAKELTFRHLAFIDWCFLEDFESGKEVSRYRPHEIFRFAAVRDWESSRLTKTLSELAEDFTPYPPGDPLGRFEVFEKNGDLPF